MLLKWLAAFFAHGLASVAALLAAVAAIWWVEPTTNGGVAFLFFMVFIVVLAVIELGRKLVRYVRPPPASEAAPETAKVEDETAGMVDAPAPAPTTVAPATDVNRSPTPPPARD